VLASWFVGVFSDATFKEDVSMPRRPRIALPGVPLHLIQRGNDRQACLFPDEDYLAYLGWLEEYAKEGDCAIPA
jgi:putative transposase